MADASGIRIVVVSGSARPGNYTHKAAALVVDELAGLEGVRAELIEPGAMNLPVPGGEEDSEDAERLRATVSGATGVILATPEYHGSFSSLMKLVIENLGFPSALSGKPVALLGVASGAIGAIKSLEHLRSVCAHVGAMVLPSLVSVAGVQKVFTPEGTCTDAGVEKRIRGTATGLVDYIRQTVCPAITLERILRGDA